MVRIFERVSYKFILGLTGTMERLDMRHLLLEKYAPICDRITIEEAENNGWVAPHREYVVMLDVDLTEYKEHSLKKCIVILTFCVFYIVYQRGMFFRSSIKVF